MIATSRPWDLEFIGTFAYGWDADALRAQIGGGAPCFAFGLDYKVRYAAGFLHPERWLGLDARDIEAAAETDFGLQAIFSGRREEFRAARRLTSAISVRGRVVGALVVNVGP